MSTHVPRPRFRPLNHHAATSNDDTRMQLQGVVFDMDGTLCQSP